VSAGVSLCVSVVWILCARKMVFSLGNLWMFSERKQKLSLDIFFICGHDKAGKHDCKKPSLAASDLGVETFNNLISFGSAIPFTK
jgi:hypothetical protein